MDGLIMQSTPYHHDSRQRSSLARLGFKLVATTGLVSFLCLFAANQTSSAKVKPCYRRNPPGRC